MTDAHMGKLTFSLVEIIDELSKAPRHLLMKDADVISGAALGLMLIAADLSGAEVKVEDVVFQ